MSVSFVEEYRTQDKSTWGDGPWQSEPDKAVWVDEATGLDCLIVRNHHGALCGYVGVAEGHPWFGRGYSECLEHGPDCEASWEHDNTGEVNVHGGLTFSGPCAESEDPSVHICHQPQPGRPEKVWWFGFDCLHAWDISPVMELHEREYYEKAKAEGDTEGIRLWGQRDTDKVYRDVLYVEREVASLAKQLADA
jgi:hypothetical protein